jgi:hypothetical protein
MPFNIDGELETFVWISLLESGLYSPSSVQNIRREPRRIEDNWFSIDDCGKTGVYQAYPGILLTPIL